MILAIDLGGTNCRSAVVTPDGTLLGQRRLATHAEQGREALLLRLTDLCRRYRQRYPITAIGLGFPGLLNKVGTIIAAPNLQSLNGFPLADWLRQTLGCPVAIVNDADAIALGEGTYGAAHAFDSYLAVTLGTGVGGGLVLNRRLWHGQHGSSAEIGHMTVVPDGRPCGCGNHGCVERYASATGILCSVAEGLGRGESSLLATEPPPLTAQMVAAAARSGDPLARRAFAYAGTTLGQALAGVFNLLDLDAVILCGGVAASFNLFRPPLLTALQRHSFVYTAHPRPVIRGKLGDRAGLLGAAVQARLAISHSCGGL